MGFFLLLHIITICAVIPFPTENYKDLSIMDSAISTIVRYCQSFFFFFCL